MNASLISIIYFKREVAVLLTRKHFKFAFLKSQSMLRYIIKRSLKSTQLVATSIGLDNDSCSEKSVVIVWIGGGSGDCVMQYHQISKTCADACVFVSDIPRLNHLLIWLIRLKHFKHP